MNMADVAATQVDPAPVPPADTGPGPTVPVMLDCNDASGFFTGHCAALMVGRTHSGGPHLQLEGDPEDRERLELDIRGFVLAGCAVPYTGRRRHVGNVHWDEFAVPAAEAARLLDHLRTLGHWQPTVGSVGLYVRWGRDRPYAAEDLLPGDGGA